MGGTATNAEGGKCDARASLTRRHSPCHPKQPLSYHGLEAGVPSCGGSQVRQRGEKPELRGQAAAQVVAVKVPARGAPEREIMGERRRTERVASAMRVLCAPPLSAPSCLLYPATARRRGCRGAAAHRSVRAVRSPSCVGTLPLRSLLSSHLREGRRSGRSWGNSDGRRGWQLSATRVLPLRAAALRPLSPPTLPQL